jgi:hypothetical protein
VALVLSGRRKTKSAIGAAIMELFRSPEFRASPSILRPLVTICQEVQAVGEGLNEVRGDLLLQVVALEIALCSQSSIDGRASRDPLAVAHGSAGSLGVPRLSDTPAQPGLAVVPKARDECRDKREPRDGPRLIETAKRAATPGRVREIGSCSSEGPASVGCKPARSVLCNGASSVADQHPRCAPTSAGPPAISARKDPQRSHEPIDQAER